MKNLIFRLLTGSVFIALVLGSIYLGTWFYLVLFGFFTLVGTWEFIRMIEVKIGEKLNTVPLMLTSFITYGLGFLVLANIDDFPIQVLFVVPVLAFMLLAFELYSKSEQALVRLASSLFPLFYVALPFALSAVLLHAETRISGLLLFAFFAVLWTNDSMAYVSGMLLGKNRLFERISPKKSWEGFIGGLLFSLLAGFLFYLFSNEFPLLFWLGYALTISLSATFGDLLESLMKRNSGIKDSGNLLPGHGGVLDRFDGALMAFPFAVAYMWFFL